MALTFAEQETVITWDRTSDMMEIYTAEPALMRRLSSLPAYEQVEQFTQDGEVVALKFRAEKKLLTLRSQRKVSTMTDEQKEAARERLRKVREIHSEKN